MALRLSVNLNKVPVCVRCKNGSIMDDHHVTYSPRPKRVWLCRQCHLGITVLNIMYGLKYGALTHTGRRKIYKKFLRHSWRMSHEKHEYTSFVYVRRRPECLVQLLATFKIKW